LYYFENPRRAWAFDRASGLKSVKNAPKMGVALQEGERNSPHISETGVIFQMDFDIQPLPALSKLLPTQ
jgi:hypothetical protein